MQIKKGHLIIILAVGLILANILMSLKSKPAGPVVSNEISATSDMRTIKEDNARAYATVNSSPGITILGARPVDNLSVAEQKSEEILVKENKAAAASVNKSSASVSSNPSQDESFSSSAGITVLGKQPSQKQKEEMKAKGVVLY